jgi:hypothetical protein
MVKPYGMGRRTNETRAEMEARYDREDREDGRFRGAHYEREDREREAPFQREYHRLLDEGADLRRQQNEMDFGLNPEGGGGPNQEDYGQRIRALEQITADLQTSFERLTAAMGQLVRGMMERGDLPWQAAGAGPVEGQGVLEGGIHGVE